MSYKLILKVVGGPMKGEQHILQEYGTLSFGKDREWERFI